MLKQPAVLRLWRRCERHALGRWLFTRGVCWKAPYFATIAPSIERLEPGLCEASIRRHRRITNHLGTVHAIALCNLAELVGGVMYEASVPADMRWIPRAMQVAYLKKAVGRLRAEARPESPLRSADSGYESPALVTVRDESGESVFSARISMWVSPRSRTTAQRRADDEDRPAH